MCFTFTGRIHTRLATLIGPLILAWLLVTVTYKPDYWTLFVLMASVGLALDAGVYGWLIGYQPRWLTLVLAASEFLILKWIMEWPYPFEIRLRTRQALELYLLAWLLIWLTLHVVLPLLWPRWAEDGGEFRLARRRIVSPAFKLPYRMAQRRQAYSRAILILVIAGLPWMIAHMLKPEGYHCTGLFLMETGHLHALAAATTGERGNNPVNLIAVLVGWLARAGRWQVLPVYMVVWVATAFAWLVGLCLAASTRVTHPWLLLIPGIMPMLLLPVPWLVLTTLLIWILAFLPWRWPDLHSLTRQRMIPLVLSVLLIWGLAWVRIASAPLLYVDEGTWQATIWLKQHVTAQTTVAVPADLRDLVTALSGQQTVHTGATADLYFGFGSVCETPATMFRHGSRCITEAKP